jgi:ABC-2 type transport system ATP-binding protein
VGEGGGGRTRRRGGAGVGVTRGSEPAPDRRASATFGLVRRGVGGCLGALIAGALVLAPAAHARDAIVTSFDGTPIVAHFFPAPGLAQGEVAPTILVGHGWGGSGANSPPPHYADAGYNVLTWDARGFGGSGGTVMIDHPEFEARDVQALIDFVAAQPEAELDAPGDPRVGMDGPSYGGGIQFITAARDPRVDAITPTIAWHSLNRALYRSEVVKAGWDLALVGLGIPTSLLPGVFSPAGVQAGHQSDFFYDAVVSGVSTGQLSPEVQRWLSEHGPDFLLERIEAPTMIVQGTADTLFTLDEAHDNYEALKRTGVPLRMMWFCGGHGVCLTGSDQQGASAITGDGGRVLERKLAWFARHLDGDRSADVGPTFEWIDETGEWRASASYPLEPVGHVTAEGSGTLPLTPGELPGSGVLIFATPSAVAVDVPIEVPEGHDVVGAPRLRLDYRATGASTRPDGRTAIFAQLVDERRDIVVNNFATPVLIELDGQPHRIELPLERIASRSTASGYTLQLVPQTSVYDLQRATGAVEIARAAIELPLVEPAGAAGDGRCANRLRGSRGKDRLTGTALSDSIAGRRGPDRLSGRGGADCLRGGRGSDRLKGGAGKDGIRPGRGRDRASGGAGRDTIRAARGGRDRIRCGGGRDKAYVHPRLDRWRGCERVARRPWSA